MEKRLKVFIFLILLFFSPSLLFSETEMTNLNTTWSSVIGGKFLSKPVLTPYGFIGVTDGRTIAAVTNNGNIIWEKNYGVNSQTILSTVSNDFTLCVTNGGKKITLFNPSGVPLWNKVLNFEVTQKAYEGHDGRFFLKGKNKIACYGMNGICKWLIDTENQSDLPLEELEDGSLIVFLKELNEGKTKALRITPFGTIIEEILFSGEILSACTTSSGIFLTFRDGSAGFFGLNKNKAENRFILDTAYFSKNVNNFFTGSNKKDQAMFVSANGNGVKLSYINSKTGKIIWAQEIDNLNIQNIIECRLTEEGFFICDSLKAVFYNLKGNLQWEGKLPDPKLKSNKWKNLVFTNNNILVLCKDNWTLDAYRVEQHAGEKKIPVRFDYYLDYLKVDSSVYDTLYLFALSDEITGHERYKKLEAGFYNEKEILYTSDILSACQAYIKQNNSTSFGKRDELNAFSANPEDLESLFNQIPLYGTRYTANLTAKLLKQESNSSVLLCLLKGINKDGYDPDGEILKALEILAGQTSTKNPVLQRAICDSVFSICRFMGRPAYNKSGKTILTNLMGPANNDTVRKHARQTLEKIGTLEKQ